MASYKMNTEDFAKVWKASLTAGHDFKKFKAALETKFDGVNPKAKIKDGTIEAKQRTLLEKMGATKAQKRKLLILSVPTKKEIDYKKMLGGLETAATPKKPKKKS